MISKAFWEKVAEKWTTDSDGIYIPEIGPIDIIPDDTEDVESIDESLEDLFADF